MEPSFAASSSIAATTASAVLTSFAPERLLTCRMMPGVPSIAAMASRSEVSKATSATSLRRTVPPVWSGMLMLATSSTVESCASVVTESF